MNKNIFSLKWGTLLSWATFPNFENKIGMNAELTADPDWKPCTLCVQFERA